MNSKDGAKTTVSEESKADPSFGPLKDLIEFVKLPAYIGWLYEPKDI